MLLNIIPDISSTKIFSEGRQTTSIRFHLVLEHQFPTDWRDIRVLNGLAVNYIHISIANTETVRIGTTVSQELKNKGYDKSLKLAITRASDVKLNLDTLAWTHEDNNDHAYLLHVNSAVGDSSEHRYRRSSRLILEGHLEIESLSEILHDFLIHRPEAIRYQKPSYEEILHFVDRHNKPFLRKLRRSLES